MNDPAVQPLNLDLDRSRELRIRWSDGKTCVYPLTLLRKACPCASCRAERERTVARSSLPVVPGGAEQATMAQVAAAELVGQYALRLTWQDGHSTGIYDFALLRALCPEAQRADEAGSGPSQTGFGSAGERKPR